MQPNGPKQLNRNQNGASRSVFECFKTIQAQTNSSIESGVEHQEWPATVAGLQQLQKLFSGMGRISMSFGPI